MKALLLGACAALLSACSAMPQQRAVSDAYASAQAAKADAVKACATSADVSGCMLGVALAFGGNGSDVVPVVQSPLSTVLNSSLLGTIAGAGIGAVRDIKVAESQERVQINNANTQAATQGAMFSAFSGIAGAGYSSVTSTAQAGFAASASSTAAIQALGTAAVNAGAATAIAVTQMPPSFQAGGDIVGRDYVRDQSNTGRDRVQGDGNETARTVDCVSTGGPGGSVAGNAASTATGTTIPTSSAYNALTSGLGGGAVNNCGG